MSTATWNLRSFPSGMCQRQHVSGLGFRRKTRTVSATEQHVPLHSDADENKNKEDIGCNTCSEDKEPEHMTDSYFLENHRLSNGVAQPMEGTEVVDILLPSVNMYTNIEDMLTG